MNVVAKQRALKRSRRIGIALAVVLTLGISVLWSLRSPNRIHYLAGFVQAGERVYRIAIDINGGGRGEVPAWFKTEIMLVLPGTGRLIDSHPPMRANVWVVEQIDPPFHFVLRGTDGTVTAPLPVLLRDPLTGRKAHIEWSNDGRLIQFNKGGHVGWPAMRPGTQWMPRQAVVTVGKGILTGAWLSGFLALLILSVTSERLWIHVDAHRCPACGYDLRGCQKPGCPECGWRRSQSATHVE